MDKLATPPLSKSIPATEPGGRKRYLDGLRGVAAAVVFIGHLWLALTGQNNPILNQNSAVCLFFALSGYVLSDLAQTSRLSFAGQTVRRYFRLFIPMLIVSSMAYLLLRFSLFSNLEAARLTGSTWLSLWYNFQPSLRNMLWETALGVFQVGSSAYNSSLWTMRTELYGSLFVFVFNATMSNRRLRVISYVAVSFWFLNDFMPMFAWGAMLYEYRAEIERYINSMGRRGVILVAAAGVLGVIFFLTALPQSSNAGAFFRWLPLLSNPDQERGWRMIGCGLILFAVLHSSSVQIVLQSRLGRFLGDVSFVLYLIHLPIICSFGSWTVVWLKRTQTPHVLVWSFCLTVIFTFALAWGTYRLIDRGPTRLSRYLGKETDRLFVPS